MFDLLKEDKAAKQAQKIEEITSKIERTENLLDNLLAEHGLTHEEVAAFVDNPKHFEDWAWAEMQKSSHQLEQKFKLDLKNIKNPNATADKYKALKFSRNWMFVK